MVPRAPNFHIENSVQKPLVWRKDTSLFPTGTSRLVAFLKTGVGKTWQKEGQKVLKVKPNTLKLFRKCQNM